MHKSTIKTSSTHSVVITNTIAQTYLLLSATLIFSSLCCYMGMQQIQANAFPQQTVIPFVIALIILLLLHKLKNTVLALPLLFTFTGLLGYTLSPYVAMYNTNSILISLSATASIFIGLTIYVAISKQRFTFMGGILFAALVALLALLIMNYFIPSDTLQLVIAFFACVLFSSFILYDTDILLKQDNPNPIIMTVSLYLDLINLFIYLLQIIGISRYR
jgi:modulator of FtsH protease